MHFEHKKSKRRNVPGHGACSDGELEVEEAVDEDSNSQWVRDSPLAKGEACSVADKAGNSHNPTVLLWLASRLVLFELHSTGGEKSVLGVEDFGRPGLLFAPSTSPLQPRIL